LTKEKQYNKELEYIYSHKKRNDLIINSVLSTPGNKIVLFDRVEEYGLKLYEQTKAIHENTFLIYGDINADERENIRLNMKDYDDAIIFASYQTSATGVSIKKLHSAWLISSTKSKIRILQSIGRLMRLHETKGGKADIYDVVDCLEYNGSKNYVMRHFEERLNQYISEEHPVKFISVSIK
jgi:superfamily II DNA or RNA helicase